MKKRRKPIIFWRHLSVDVGRKTVGKEKKTFEVQLKREKNLCFPTKQSWLSRKWSFQWTWPETKKLFFRILGNAILKRWSKQSINGVDVRKC